MQGKNCRILLRKPNKNIQLGISFPEIWYLFVQSQSHRESECPWAGGQKIIRQCVLCSDIKVLMHFISPPDVSQGSWGKATSTKNPLVSLSCVWSINILTSGRIMAIRVTNTRTWRVSAQWSCGGMFCVFVVYNLRIFCPRHNKMSTIISSEHLSYTIHIHDLIRHIPSTYSFDVT